MTEAVLAAAESEGGQGMAITLGVSVFIGLIVLLLITLQFDRHNNR